MCVRARRAPSRALVREAGGRAGGLAGTRAVWAMACVRLVRGVCRCNWWCCFGWDFILPLNTSRPGRPPRLAPLPQRTAAGRLAGARSGGAPKRGRAQKRSAGDPLAGQKRSNSGAISEQLRRSQSGREWPEQRWASPAEQPARARCVARSATHLVQRRGLWGGRNKRIHPAKDLMQ